MILKSREEAEEEQTSPSFLSPSPLFRDTAVVQSSLPWELPFILGEWFEPRLSQPHFCLSSLGWPIQQKQKSPYTQGTEEGGVEGTCVRPNCPTVVGVIKQHDLSWEQCGNLGQKP